jgi:hypothetical protein
MIKKQVDAPADQVWELVAVIIILPTAADIMLMSGLDTMRPMRLNEGKQT